jgi:preprotein translocase subunit SecY
MAISGASLLIVVSVVLETVRQIDSQLVMRDYEHL